MTQRASERKVRARARDPAVELDRPMIRCIEEANTILRLPLLPARTCRRMVQTLKGVRGWRGAQVSIETRDHRFRSFTRHDIRSAQLLPWKRTDIVCREFEAQLEQVVKPLLRRRWGVEAPDHSGTQVVRYPAGGHYLAHQDAGPDFPRRYFTVVCYLNDDFEGGHTWFPSLEYSAAPRCGTAIVFPAHYYHCAQPVTAGEKLVIVSWLEGPPYIRWI